MPPLDALRTGVTNKTTIAAECAAIGALLAQQKRVIALITFVPCHQNENDVTTIATDPTTTATSTTSTATAAATTITTTTTTETTTTTTTTIMIVLSTMIHCTLQIFNKPSSLQQAHLL